MLLGSMPSILEVLEDMGGQAPSMQHLCTGDRDGTLKFSGADGDLLLPSLDATALLATAGLARFARVSMCIELNSDAYDQGLGVVLEASPLMENTVDEEGLAMYVRNGYGMSNDRKQSAVKFHPGMWGGQLRVEGRGGWGNQDIGFTPENWQQSGHAFHMLELTLGSDGENQVCIKGTQHGQLWQQSWTHQLTDGRYFLAVYAWLDLGSEESPLHIGTISLRVQRQ